MKHIKKIYKIGVYTVLVYTASGGWSSATRVDYNGTPPAHYRHYLRWMSNTRGWYSDGPSIGTPKAVLISEAELPPLHRSLLNRYAWMFVVPFTWKRENTYLYVDMPLK